jgi:hypothetical protein
MRSTVKLNLADELYSEFVPTEVTTLGHSSGAPSSTAGPREPSPQNEVLHASSTVLSQRIARSSGGAGSLDHHCAARYLPCHDVCAGSIGPTNPALHETTNRNGARSPCAVGCRALVASEPTPFSRTVAFGPSEVADEMALVGKATSESYLYQV